MVLSEEQKKQLVERLKVGREQKAAEKAAPKSPFQKGANPQTPAPKAKAEKPPKAPKAAPKPAPIDEPSVIQFEDPLPPPVITDEPPKKAAPKKAQEPCIFEDIEEEQTRGHPATRKEKRLNKEKYMSIKFYQKPDEAIYKKVMKSVQPDSSSDEEPHEGLRILDYDKAKKTVITEAERADIERRKMEAIVRLMG